MYTSGALPRSIYQVSTDNYMVNRTCHIINHTLKYTLGVHLQILMFFPGFEGHRAFGLRWLLT